MNLYKNFTGAEEFSKLTVEEQYLSYLNSFRNIRDPRDQPLKWAKRIINQYGRDVLPYLEKDLEINDVEHIFRKPYDDPLGLISYLLSELVERKELSKEEQYFYQVIYFKKLDEYILKYMIIDGTVRVVIKTISFFSDLPSDFPFDSLSLKSYYEEKLQVKDIIAGDFYSYWDYEEAKPQ